MACTNGIITRYAEDGAQLDRRKFFETFREHFRKDFDFIDVRDDLKKNLLTEEECRQIEEDGEEKQLERLFFLLTYNENKSVREFVDKIRLVYYWLSDGMDAYLKEPKNLELELYETCINRSWIPNKRNVHVHRCELLWEVIQNLRTLHRQQYLIIRGKMGFGKAWLAIDACTDYAVIRSMDYQILWVNVTKCDTPEGILNEMQTLKIMMRSSHSNIEQLIGPEYDSVQLRILELKKYFQNTFSSDKYQNALLVLCNVQNKEVLEAFDFQCKILATGRNESCFDEIPKNRKRFVVIDRGLTEQQSLDFFDKLGLFSTKTDSWYQRKVRHIHQLCQGEPIIMSLISNNIMQLNGRSRVEPKLSSYESQLRRNQLADSQMELTIEESLNVLTNDVREAYQRMVVFPDNIYVPISVLARYWAMDEEKTEELVINLYRLSLLTLDYRAVSTRNTEQTAFVSMHYIYSSYLRKLYDAEELQQMHLDICNAYEIESLLSRRTEPELSDLPDDGYVHYYIGYHLQRSGQPHLFSTLYFDFGFLEQKLRYTGLPNTHGDLEAYRTEIVGNDEHKRLLWDELLDFLPTIEEMVYQNGDTSLLQYALNASAIIAKEAKRQAKQFGNRVWFDDFGHPAKQRRQMVQLQRRPMVLKFYGPEAVIAALDDNSILLTDLSPSYVTEPTMLKEHTRPVHKLATFGSDYLISLDKGGTLLVWSLRDTPIHLAKYSDGSSSNRSFDGSPDQTDHVFKMRQYDVRNINYRQAVSRITDDNVIECFTIHESEIGTTVNRNGYGNGNGMVAQKRIRLFCGTRKGPICSYEWCDKREEFINRQYFKSDCENHRALHYLAPFCLIILSDKHLTFLNLKDTSLMYINSNWVHVPDPLAIYEFPSDAENCEARTIYCVFRQRIVRINIDRIVGMLVITSTIQDVYKPRTGAAISCSTQSDDGKYLVLGTERGIVVFDCGTDTELQRNSNGYRIACLDMCACDDLNYRYLIVSGTENGVQGVVNICGLPGRRNIVGRTMSSDRAVAHHGRTAKLVGDGLFEVINREDFLMIYAVDMANVIHVLKGREPSAMIGGPQSKITCTGQWCGMFCFGTNDGKFYVAARGADQGPIEYKLYADMREAIVYIKGIDPTYCVVASETQYKILNWWNIDQAIFQTGKIVDCFAMDSSGRIMIVREHAPVQLVDMSTPIESRVEFLAETSDNELIVGCTYQTDVLVLLMKDGKFRFFGVDKEKPDEIELQPLPKELIQYRVTAMALSKDLAHFAVGTENGDIYIYRMSDMQSLQVLTSHNQPIKQLVFSPWTGENVPIVLVSLSEQMCFWNIKYVINNPLDAVKKRGVRRSSRFSKELKWTFNGGGGGGGDNEIINGNGTNGNGKVALYDADSIVNYWDNKTGASDKPELLACIKFVGNGALKLVTNKDFSKFITIDNEGDVYALTTRETSAGRPAAMIKRFGNISLGNTLTVSS